MGVVSLALLLAGAPTTRGQEAVVLTEGDALAVMKERVGIFVEALIEYTRDVRLSETGLEQVLDQHAALEELHGEEEATQIVEAAFQDGGYDFGVVVDDPRYVAWSRERGLEPAGFFHQFLRLQALWMREESLAGLSRALEELPRQRAELDAARERMGQEAYGKGVAALDEARGLILETRAMMERLPVAGAEEAALLARHDRRIRETLGEGEPSRE